MITVTEKLKLGKASYPQLKRLPAYTRFVKQLGFKSYAAFTLDGTLILINAGNSIKEARKNSLAELNKRLRQYRLIHGRNCKNYKEAIAG